MIKGLFRLFSSPDRSFTALGGGAYDGEQSAFHDWLERVRSGSLLPNAPRVSSIGHATPPLQFWGARALDQLLPQETFLSALPEMISLGLSIDHFEPLNSPLNSKAVSCVGAAKKPLSHLAIEHPSGKTEPFIRALFDLGADPDARDAYGAPALALCRVGPATAHQALRLWDLFVERGADPQASLWLSESPQGGRIRMLGHALFPHLSLPRVIDLARAASSPACPDFVGQAEAIAQARELDICARAAPLSRREAFL